MCTVTATHGFQNLSGFQGTGLIGIDGVGGYIIYQDIWAYNDYYLEYVVTSRRYRYRLAQSWISLLRPNYTCRRRAKDPGVRKASKEEGTSTK